MGSNDPWQFLRLNDSRSRTNERVFYKRSTHENLRLRCIAERCCRRRRQVYRGITICRYAESANSSLPYCSLILLSPIGARLSRTTVLSHPCFVIHFRRRMSQTSSLLAWQPVFTDGFTHFCLLRWSFHYSRTRSAQSEILPRFQVSER